MAPARATLSVDAIVIVTEVALVLSVLGMLVAMVVV